MSTVVQRPNFQFAILDSTIRSQEVLGNKQGTDSQGGILATNLLSLEYEEATTVLQYDTDKVQAQKADSGEFNKYNQIYQNDAAVTQTGESNASTGVDTEQTQVSQDGTNLSNLVSLSQTLITIGQYVASMISSAYP